MKRFVLGLGCVLAMLPGVASAGTLSLDPSPNHITVTQGSIPSVEQAFDLVFTETGANENEGLFAYDLYVIRSNPVISLAHADKPDNWVFKASDASFGQADVPGSNPPGGIVVNAIGSFINAPEDIVSGTKAARVFFTIAQSAAPGDYTISLDRTPGTSLFVSGDPNRPDPNIDVATTVATITVVPVPEPASLSLLGIAGLLALRRRRSA